MRARVTNTPGQLGNPDKAEGCIGYLAGFERWDPAAGAFINTAYQDFLRLEWSFNRETVGMDLLPGIPNWLDVCYVLPPKLAEEPAVLKLANNPPVHRYGKGFELPGMYRVKVQVSGKNFGAKALQFYVLVPAASMRPEILDDTSWRARLADLNPVSGPEATARSHEDTAAAAS